MESTIHIQHLWIHEKCQKECTLNLNHQRVTREKENPPTFRFCYKLILENIFQEINFPDNFCKKSWKTISKKIILIPSFDIVILILRNGYKLYVSPKKEEKSFSLQVITFFKEIFLL